MMRYVLIATLLVLGGCAGMEPAGPTFEAPPDRTPDGLIRTESPIFELVYLKPGLSLAGYDKIQVRPIGIGYKAEPGRVRLFRGDGNFKLTQEQKTLASRRFAEAFAHAMTADGRFRLVTQPEPRAIRVNIALARLEWNVPETSSSENEALMIDKVGEMTLVIDIVDAVTGEPLARGRDTFVARGDQVRSRDDIAVAMRDLFARWTRQLRQGFDGLS